jgi:hypothetical protein
MCPAAHAVLSHPQVLQAPSLNNAHKINHLTLGFPPAFIHTAATAAEAKPMTHIDSAADQNQIQKSLVPMLRTWTHSIGWTVLLSAALAVLFAMLCDGCSRIH